ncbi:SAM-dependent methyltransferase [Sphingobium algorifonticola]|uniref:Class I SAM-dependent methyltransferase n=1 Tax=Sphingobium algorifonticola TaxID=2008318 RepID=A0A437J8H3_9SPHN|nr:cyclopropane-fatty-acyl-phospholipid synthase family protein [Sphingobium algorifonticola]RVT41693.1 class I SAM-dependent methyltransferase [Sphingobium algorifonticola]
MWLLERLLPRLIRKGRLTVVAPDGKARTFGDGDPQWPCLTLRLHDGKVAGEIVRDPRLGLGEAYMDGRITIEGGDILDFVTFIRANRPWESGDYGLKRKGALSGIAGDMIGRINRLNQRARSKANVAHHYDLSDRLYDLFLDADRQYSCAYWTDPANSLEQAQTDKKAHIAAKLHLSPGQKVLDIGCGWGGMALYLNRMCDVDVLGITLSQEQLKIARERAQAAGVAERVRFELIDYRDVQGRFDRIVSVGMFEHVGPAHYREFFRCCHNLLTTDGVMLLHTIGRVGKPGTTDAWTRKYIFPGGYSPSLSEVVAASERNKLMLTDVEVLRLHYAHTLRQWYMRVQARQAEIEALYDARFFRMWSFYLAGATAAFESGGMVNFQLQYARNRHTLPITRDYMVQAEKHLRDLA